MNYLIGAVGAHVTLSLISGVTSAFNGVHTFCKTIAKSTSNGASEVRSIIKETDLEFKVKHARSLLCELKIDEKTPYTIRQCVNEINNAIKDINDELEKIHYRMQYNDNLWIGSRVRSYKFHNCRKRLVDHLKNLGERCDALIKTLSIQTILVQNVDLDDPSRYILQIDQIDPKIAKKSSEDLHNKLTYITK